MTYISKTYGTGTIIARYDGWIVVKFPHPPGMIKSGGVIPIVHIREEQK